MNSGIIHKSSCRLVLCRLSVRQNRIIHSLVALILAQKRQLGASSRVKLVDMAHTPAPKGQVGKIDEKGSLKLPFENYNTGFQISGT